jgi:uncharacterized membrane protein YeaQ/YmgE (transglycosylase-associated protein family)
MALGALFVTLVIVFVAGNFLFGGLLDILIALVVWGIIGSLAGNILRGRGFGIVGNIILGLLGGITGSFVFHLIGWGGVLDIPFIGFLAAGTMGAILFIFAMRLIDHNFAR